MEEAQQAGEIDANMDVRAVAEFIEDAGKGSHGYHEGEKEFCTHR